MRLLDDYEALEDYENLKIIFADHKEDLEDLAYTSTSLSFISNKEADLECSTAIISENERTKCQKLKVG